MNYRSILLIFPSISLLSENFTKLRGLERFSQYKIHTLSESEFKKEDSNIFIFTPERYLSFFDKHQDMQFDFSFVDEIYKIDNSFILDQETTGENERDVAYRVALNYICSSSYNMLLTGPYMAFPDEASVDMQSITNFAKDNEFEFLDYNSIEIVDKVYEDIKGKQSYTIDGIAIEIGSVTKIKKITNIITKLSTSAENTIVYCNRRSSTESYVKKIIENQSTLAQMESLCRDNTTQVYKDFIQHLEHTFGADWIVLKALKHNIGIHHSLIPKYIQKEIISLFNDGILIALFSTTTITEGVNTTAKNIVVTSDKKGNKPLKKFDAKNIAGRAGRFHKHFVGRVLSIDNDFFAIVSGDEDILRHKNYDNDSPKTDVDFQITNEKYLSLDDLQEKNHIDELVRASHIPTEVFNTFKVVGPKHKLSLYKRLTQLSQNHVGLIQTLSQKLARSRASRLEWDGFQIIMDTIYPIVVEPNLRDVIDLKVRSGHSLITVLLHSYLENGYMGMVKYYVETKDNTTDEAIKKVSNFVYNIFKYHLVKYLGLFDIFYRYIIASRTDRHIDDVVGIGILLQKLEYNALSSVARRLSDFGVPFSLVAYYDQENIQISKRFDAYEQHIDDQIQSLLD